MYRAFRLEAEDAAGAYDGRSVTLQRASTPSREIAVHESIHERLFHETHDGIMHRLLIRRADLHGDAEAEEGSNLLMGETEFAHEAAASFLGIQALDDDDERAEVFCNMPPVCQTDYQVMAQVITPLTSSTYLAFCLGWSLAFWAFQSERLFETYCAGWESFDEVLARVPSPTDRMRAGVAFLRSSGPAWLAAALDAATSTFLEDGASIWDVHDDEQWRQQPKSSVGRFEAHLSAELWRWLREHGPLPTSGHEERPDGFDTWLLDQLDVPPEQKHLIIKGDTYDADPENELVLAIAGALRGGKARVTNPDVEQVERLRTRQPHDRGKALRRFTGHAPAAYFIGSATPCGTKGWAVYVYKQDRGSEWSSGGSALADRFIVVEDFAVDLISRLHHAHPWQIAAPSLFMAAVNSESLAARVDELDALIRDVPSSGDGSQRCDGPGWPLWYWTGDWPELLASPGAATSARQLELAGTGTTETYILHFARIEGLPGYLIKLAAPLPAEAVLRYEVALKTGGSLETIAEDEVTRICGQLSGYLAIVLQNWYLF